MLSYEEISSLVNQIFWLIVKYKLITFIIVVLLSSPKVFLSVIRKDLDKRKKILEDIKEAEKRINNQTDQPNKVRSNYKSTSIGFVTTSITDKKES